jgi:outer membrane protein TolC
MQIRLSLTSILLVITQVSFTQSLNLSYYLEKGIANSPLLNDYRNQALSAASDSLLVRSSQKPLIEGNTYFQYSPYGRNFGYDEVITDGGNYSALVGVSQNIFNQKSLLNSYNAAAVLKQAARNSARISSIELKKLITEQYLTTFTDQTDLDFNISFLDLFREESTIMEQLVRSGTAKQTDYLSLKVEQKTQEILVRNLKSQYRKDFLLLNQVCGIRDTAVYVLEEPSIILSGAKDVRRDPSFIKLYIDSLKIGNETEAIDLRYKPKVKWFADAGIMTSNPWNFYNHFGFSAGVSLNVPIYDGNQKSIEKGKLAYEENSRQQYKEAYINQYNLQIAQLENQLKTLDESEVDLKEQVKTSEVLVKALRAQLEAGLAGITDYINAVKNMRNSGRELNMTHIRKLQVINEINFLLTH